MRYFDRDALLQDHQRSIPQTARRCRWIGQFRRVRAGKEIYLQPRHLPTSLSIDPTHHGLLSATSISRHVLPYHDDRPKP